MASSPLLSLPDSVLNAVADALLRDAQSCRGGGALVGLRGTCRRLRMLANARTRHLLIRVCDRMPAPLASIAQHFPAATTVELENNNSLGWLRSAIGGLDSLVDDLAALPNGCFQAAEAFRFQERMPAPVAAHAGRLCARLREAAVTCGQGEGAALVAALQGLAAVAGTLQTLEVQLESHAALGGVPRASQALARLTGLRRLKLGIRNKARLDDPGLLANALPALTALSSLAVECECDAATLSPQLGARPEALRELSLRSRDEPWALDALRSTLPLPGVTKLAIHGCHGGPCVLALACRRCPALRDLDLEDLDVGQPPASLAHLTRLSMRYCAAAPQLRLESAAPSLRALSCFRPADKHVAAAAAEHPWLQQLDLHLMDSTSDFVEDGSWLRAAESLLGLTRLALALVPPYCEHGGLGELLRLCGSLYRCPRLEHLELDADGGFEPHEVLAAVGLAAGRGLRSLTVAGVKQPPTADDAARVLHTLVTSYPQLEALTLKLETPYRVDYRYNEAMDTDLYASEARAWEVLQPAAPVADLCPALREVRVVPSCVYHGALEYRSDRAAVWLRPAAQAAGLVQSAAR